MARSKSQKPSREANRLKTKVTANAKILVLRGKAREIFVNAILNPPPPNEALRTAAQRELTGR